MSSPTVEYRRLGSCGLKVSVPILGAMSFGSPAWIDWVLDAEQSLPILKAAWDRGINTFDTANVYCNGESERVIAKFVEKYSIPRSEILIFTKCYGLVAKEIGIRTVFHPEMKKIRDYVNQSGLSRAAIFNAVEASLARLNTTYIDLLQIHRFDPDTPIEETMKALHDLVQSGKVRYIGASSMRAWQFSLMNEVANRHGWTEFVSMQNEVSLLYREEEREMLAYCKFKGIGVIPWGPLNGGALSRPVDRTNDTLRGAAKPPLEGPDKVIISRVEELAKKYGKSMTQVALVWATSKVTSPIVGTSSLQRLEENIDIAFELSEEDIKYLEEPYVPKPVRGHA
ncbi:Aldo keto reductase [Mucidula mucida]|nr:Aldo keto reductase [Mucidula mucida]